MQIDSIISGKKINTKIILFDIIAITVIYLVPVISHKFSLPIYYLEPMRMAIIFSLLFANFKNSVFIALTLPLFSFLISAHPVFIKSVLISSELLINVVLFYWFMNYSKNNTLVFTAALICSKVYYYGVKFLLLKFTILNGSLISTPILIQAIMIIVFTASFLIIERFYVKEKS